MVWIKRIALAVGILVLLLAIGIGIVFATFDPNDYKPKLVDLVKEKKQRTLTMGDIKLSVFPNIALVLKDASLSEHNRPDEFVRVGEVRVGVKLMPLMSKRVVIDEISLDAPSLTVVRGKDGRFNFDDLMEKSASEPTTESQQVELKVARAEIKQGELRFRDEMAGRTVEVKALDLTATDIDPETGATLKLSAAAKSDAPQLDGKLSFAGKVQRLDEGKRLVLSGLDAAFEGAAVGQHGLKGSVTGDVEWAGGDLSVRTLKLQASQNDAGRTLDAELNAPTVVVKTAAEGGPQLQVEGVEAKADYKDAAQAAKLTLKVPKLVASPQHAEGQAITFDASRQQGKDEATLTGRLDGFAGNSKQLKIQKADLKANGKFGEQAVEATLVSPLSVELAPFAVSLDNLNTQGKASVPKLPGLSWQLHGQAGMKTAPESARIKLSGKLDASQADLDASVAGFKQPKLTLKLALDALNLDRYLPKSAEKPASPAQGQPSGGSNAVLVPDLPIFKQLSGTADVKIGKLTRAPWVVNDLSVHFDAKPGEWRIDPFLFGLAQGKVQGSATAHWGAKPSFNLAPRLEGVAVGELVKNAIGEERVTGTGNLSANLSVAGRTMPEFMQSLNGDARVKLSNGAVKGISILDTVQKAQASVNSLREKRSSAASETAKTEFSDLSASFRFDNGVAKNEDLKLVGPLVTGSGKGTANLPKQTLDYNLLGGIEYKKEAGAMGGLQVPVHIQGTFAQPVFTVDYGAVATQLLQNKLKVDTEAEKAKLEASKTKAKEKAASQVQQQKDKLKDKLKGLFGK